MGSLGRAAMRYIPNPAHKRKKTEVSSAKLRPEKTPFPPEMTSADSKALLLSSIPENPDNPQSRRFVARHGSSGLEFFAARATRTDNFGEVEYHGYPVNGVPGKVLRQLKNDGHITNAEYNRYRKLS